MEAERRSRRARARVTHSSPGRVRARVARTDRSGLDLEQVRRRLEANPDIESIALDQRTGSVLVQGPATDRLRFALAEVLQLVDESGADGVGAAGVSIAVNLVKGADGRLEQASGGRLSLRWIVPVSFAAVGVRQLVRQGLSAGSVPWYVLLYYAVDSFLKLYPEHAPRPASALTEEV